MLLAIVWGRERKLKKTNIFISLGTWVASPYHGSSYLSESIILRVFNNLSSLEVFRSYQDSGWIITAWYHYYKSRYQNCDWVRGNRYNDFFPDGMWKHIVPPSLASTALCAHKGLICEGEEVSLWYNTPISDPTCRRKAILTWFKVLLSPQAF